MKPTSVIRLLAALLLTTWASLTFAQGTIAPTIQSANPVIDEQSDANAARKTEADQPSPSESEQAQAQAQTKAELSDTQERLQLIQNVLTNKLAERSRLGEEIEAANEQDKIDLRVQADNVSDDIKQLRRTLESVATGGVDISLFVQEQEPEESDWREDITLIARPVIDSLKELTDKPRKLKALNDEVALRQQELAIAEEALQNLQPTAEFISDGDLDNSLDLLLRTWSSRRDDAANAIDIANFQISDLQGDKPIFETITNALLTFVKGRGLTIALAIASALGVWFAVRFLLKGYRAALVNKSQAESRTRYRLAEYSVHALTFVLILIAVFVVFYERGDVLLLGLLILLMVGLALGIRQLLPRYVSEARLLLNIGAMREAERVLYRGLPWRVESINMYTVLRNPELHGVLRIPLAEFHGVSSRPAGKDNWFPTSRGDIILLNDDDLFEVIDQNPDTVELRERGGQVRSIPTVEFYNTSMINLTRSGTFGVVNTFGIDYGHQKISTSDVPKILREAVRESLAHSDLADFVKDIQVELKAAGSSSIDYWIFVTMESKAAKSYLRIQRAVQSACVDVCTSQNWTIPFPHISLVQKQNPLSQVKQQNPLSPAA